MSALFLAQTAYSVFQPVSQYGMLLKVERNCTPERYSENQSKVSLKC